MAKVKKKSKKVATRMAPKRKDPSQALRALVLAEAGHKCASPTCRGVITLDLHHIVWVKDNGPTTVENLLALCPYCHGMHTQGHVGAEAIRSWKYTLQSLNNPHRASADLLLLLHREEREKASDPKRVPFCFTGDSLGMLAGLINAGLVEIPRRVANYGHFGGGTPYFHVALTEAGRGLVDAWMSGSPADLGRALRTAAESPRPSLAPQRGDTPPKMADDSTASSS